MSLDLDLTDQVTTKESPCRGAMHVKSVESLNVLLLIVRVQYFVRGGFVVTALLQVQKHLSFHLPVDELDSSGVKKGLRCTCRCTCGCRVHKESQLDVDVFEK
ncbi:hypothetical protein TNCV_2244031 [Trichonephila clavipes]|nr:hypothetical protein TNCV_2244031 [Trichonephila clavipes]